MDEESMWGIGVAEGIVAILFGFGAVFWPQLTIVTLLYLFAGFILASGLVNLVAGLFRIGQGIEAWLLRVLLSVVEIAVGVYLLRHPNVTFTTFILIVGFVLIFRGVFEIVMSFMLDFVSGGSRALLLIAGVLAILVGLIILFQPVAGGIAFVWVLGLYALITGPILIARSLSARKLETSRK